MQEGKAILAVAPHIVPGVLDPRLGLGVNTWTLGDEGPDPRPLQQILQCLCIAFADCKAFHDSAVGIMGIGTAFIVDDQGCQLIVQVQFPLRFAHAALQAGKDLIHGFIKSGPGLLQFRAGHSISRFNTLASGRCV